LHHIRRRTTIAAAVGLLVLSVSTSGCGGAQGSSPTIGSTATGPPGASSPQALAKALLLDFEQPLPTLSGGARIPSGLRDGPRGEVAVSGQEAAPLRVVSGRDGKGHAIAFPAPCPASREKTCPKEIIEVYPATSLAPGSDEFEWGASVRLEKAETAKGSNIIQKGFSLGGGSQWKLQVDGAAGQPSCVVVGLNDTEIHEVLSDVTVADGAWHDVVCRRSADELVVTVDGAKKKSVLIPKDLTVAPTGPVRIGGKDLKPDNDQYFGTVDDVYVAVLQ
jgi:Concanavalin A-like lectin/glucanases superfamily